MTTRTSLHVMGIPRPARVIDTVAILRSAVTSGLITDAQAAEIATRSRLLSVTCGQHTMAG